MTTREIILSIVIVILAVFLFLSGGGFFLMYKFYNEKPAAEWIAKTTPTVIDKKPPSYNTGDPFNLKIIEFYKKCFDSPLIADGIMRGSVYEVDIHDDCKHASRSLKLSIPVRHHEVMPFMIGMVGWESVGKKFVGGYGGGIQYRYSFGPVDVGPAVGGFKIGSITGAFVMVGASVKL